MPMVSGFPNCCGASIITGFGLPCQLPTGAGPVWDAKTQRYTYPGAIKDEEGLMAYMVHLLQKEKKNHMYVCILNGNQVKAENGLWLRVLKKLGFKFLMRAHNSIHSTAEGGTRLYLFGLPAGAASEKHHNEAPEGWDDIDPAEVKTPETVLVSTPTVKNGKLNMNPPAEAVPWNDFVRG